MDPAHDNVPRSAIAVTLIPLGMTDALVGLRVSDEAERIRARLERVSRERLRPGGVDPQLAGGEHPPAGGPQSCIALLLLRIDVLSSGAKAFAGLFPHRE
jgi:hypothetical protein